METTLELVTDEVVTAETAANGGDAARRDALAERLFASLLGGMELLSVDVGRRLGLYAALRERAGITAAELAARAGDAERYAREWLEQQAVAGIVDVDGPDLPAARRRYRLPEGHTAVLVDADSPAYLQGAPPSLTGLARTLGAVVDAYRTGNGVRYADFGADIRHGIGAFNRPMFVNELTTWLRALPDVHDRLTRGGRVLDVGCGTAWSSIALAQHFPRVTVHAIDVPRGPGTFGPGRPGRGPDLIAVRRGRTADDDVVGTMSVDTVVESVDWAYGAEVEDFVSEWAGLPYEDELPIGGTEAVEHAAHVI